jgi:hypothetical protein
MNFNPCFPYCLTESGVNRYSGSRSLLKGKHEILSIFSTFFIWFGNNAVQNVSTKIHGMIVNLWKSVQLKSYFTQKHKCIDVCTSSFFRGWRWGRSNLSEIPCKVLKIMVLIIYDFSENLHIEDHTVHRVSKKLLLHMCLWYCKILWKKKVPWKSLFTVSQSTLFTILSSHYHYVLLGFLLFYTSTIVF